MGMVALEVPAASGTNGNAGSAVLHRSIHNDVMFPKLVGGNGSFLYTDDDRKIFDASGGAAVACIGHGSDRVQKAVVDQMKKVSYCASTFYTTGAYEELCQLLVGSTKGHMAKAYIVNSGSEAMEAALKLSRQFFLEKDPPEPQRTRFIARRQSYHGTTLGSLSVGGHKARRAKFEPMLLHNISHVSPCYAYRGKLDGELDDAYVARLAAELEQEFQRLGPDTVCAFVAEPVVGAALGCVGSVPGYFAAMKNICNKYGALLIMDEVMSGMGRTGTMHAWEQEGAVPDVQTIGKALGGGYQPVAGVLINHRVVQALDKGSGAFAHGHTYQGHAVGCAAALEVQRIIMECNLIENASKMGDLLGKGLQQRLGAHPNVGNIRGRGLFWAIEFVKNKTTKDPFPVSDGVAMAICDMGFQKPYCIGVYPGTGTADGTNGDHIIIAPAYNVVSSDVKWIVDTVGTVVEEYFRLRNFSGSA